MGIKLCPILTLPRRESAMSVLCASKVIAEMRLNVTNTKPFQKKLSSGVNSKGIFLGLKFSGHRILNKKLLVCLPGGEGVTWYVSFSESKATFPDS